MPDASSCLTAVSPDRSVRDPVCCLTAVFQGSLVLNRFFFFFYGNSEQGEEGRFAGALIRPFSLLSGVLRVQCKGFIFTWKLFSKCDCLEREKLPNNWFSLLRVLLEGTDQVLVGINGRGSHSLDYRDSSEGFFPGTFSEQMTLPLFVTVSHRLKVCVSFCPLPQICMLKP